MLQREAGLFQAKEASMEVSPADQENVDLLCGRGFLFLLGIFSQFGQVE